MNIATELAAAGLREGDSRCRAMFDGAALGIAICRLDGRILEINSALRKMLGYATDSGDDTEAGDGGVAGKIDPETFLPDETSLAELVRGQRTSIETERTYYRADGTDFWGHQTVSLGRDARRQPALLIAMLADATERKRIEEHLRQVDKLETIGRLAGAIAHDFNNLLTGILLYCDLLSARLETGGLNANGLRQGVNEIRMAGEQGAALTQQLLAIERKQTTERRPIQLNEIVTSTENLLRRLLGEHVALVTLLAAGSTLVLADTAELRQVLLNLVLNARDAIPHSGTVHVSTALREFPGEVNRAQPRRAVSLTVTDNGGGMDAETRARIFEPFFTTKNKGKGTGLGLAMVQRIVSEARGTIEVESEPGHGTSFEVLLPALAVSPQSGGEPTAGAETEKNRLLESMGEILHGP